MLPLSLSHDQIVTVSLEVLHNGVTHAMSLSESSENHGNWSLGTNEVTFHAVIDEHYKVSRLEQRILIRESGNWNIHTNFQFPLPDALLHIPAVMYRDNDRGKGSFPTGGFDCGWYFCEDRMPIPGCVQCYSPQKCVTMFLNPSANPSHLLSIRATRSNDTVLISSQFPSNESPVSYSGKILNPRIDHKEGEISLEVKNEPIEVTRTFYFAFSDNEKHIPSHQFALVAYEKVVEYILDTWTIEKSNDEFVSWNEYFDAKMTHLRFLTERTSEGTYLKMGKNNPPELQPYYEYTGASFLIKSLEAAVIYAKTGDVDTAEAIGRYFLQAEQLPGVFRENHSLTTGEWGGYLGVGEDDSLKFLVNSRCVGEALLNYVELYEILKSKGRNVPEFIELSKRVANFYTRVQLPDGCFGRWFTPDGNPVNSMGTNGAHIIPFFLKLAKHLDNTEEIQKSLDKACQYYQGVIDNSDFYGDTLDADAYDKESAVILMRACLDLFEHTKNREWLDYAKKCARFALTWIWQYNVAFPEGSPLNKAQFLTIGITSVSVAHHHHDFYGMTMGYDFFRLSKFTNNTMYAKIASLLINACRQMISNDRHSYDKPPEMFGWQPEQMDYTDWDYFHAFPVSKGQFNVCIAWLTVLGLNAYLSLREKNFIG